MFWHQRSYYNPASTGLFYQHQAFTTARSQWAGFSDNPVTLSALYDIRLSVIHGGAGLNYTYDQLGATTNHKIYLNYAFHISLSDAQTISIGLSGGIHNAFLEGTELSPIVPNDPALIRQDESESVFNIASGVYYRSEHLELGVSTTQINEADFDKLGYSNKRHYWMYSSYRFDIGETFSINPTLLIKSDIATISEDFHVRFILKERYWSGLAWRPDDAVAFMLGVDVLDKYRAGYSYDHILSKIGNHSFGSHEFVLGMFLR